MTCYQHVATSSTLTVLSSVFLCVSRFSADEALKHEFIADYDNANDVDLLQQIADNLKKRNYSNKLLSIMVAACLEEIDEIDLDVVREAFPNLDDKGTGFVDEAAICRFLVLNSNISRNYREQQAKTVMDVISKSISNMSSNHTIGPSMSIPSDAFSNLSGSNEETATNTALNAQSGDIMINPIKPQGVNTGSSGPSSGLSIIAPNALTPTISDAVPSPLSVSPTDQAMLHYQNSAKYANEAKANETDESANSAKKARKVQFSGQDVLENVNEDQKENVDDKKDGDNDEEEEEDSPQKYLSVEVFKQIMAKSGGKKYKVDDLVGELDPRKSGQISFAAIAKYSGLLQTVSISMYDEDH